MRIWPKSLISQLLIVVVIALILSQLIILAIFHFDRQDLIFSARRLSLAQRVTAIAQAFSVTKEQDYDTLLSAISSPNLRIRFISENNVYKDTVFPKEDSSSLGLYRNLSENLSGEYAIKVRRFFDDNSEQPGWVDQMQKMHYRHHRMQPTQEHLTQMSNFHSQFIVQLRLENGRWIEIYNNLPIQTFEKWPVNLILSAFVILLTSGLLIVFLMRRIVNPLRELSTAADSFGKNIKSVVLKETGAIEIRQTAHAFNIMQQRLQRYIEDRTEIISAVSHDLKTPVTRMRLRSEMMNDEDLKQKFCHDLDEMTEMVNQTIEFMRGEESTEEIVNFDFNAMLESIQSDRKDLNQFFSINGVVKKPYPGRIISLKRCLNNLLDNSFRHADKVCISLEQIDGCLIIKIIDNGSGIPESMLTKVFDPFTQLDSSRSSEGGNYGLGLGIARNIARGHGGDLILYNAKGLVAEITLPY